jgi:DegV family protein with EDD domain
MKIQVVTDSTSDIPQDLADKLGIRVIPIRVRFGDKVYRDGVEIDSDAFYRMLATTTAHPGTSQPTPEDFEGVYREYCEKVDGIISVHISSKISGTCNSAMIAKNKLGGKCPIDVVDSQFNSAGLALITMAAAELSRAGKSLATIVEEIQHCISSTYMLGVFDTMKYLAWSGRVNKAIVAAANVLNVKPLLTFRNGDIIRAGLVRSFSKGMESLYKFVEEKRNIAAMAIVHSAIPEQAEKLRKRLGDFFPEDKINVMKMGAGLGVHGGPGVLLVALREA